MTLCVVDNKSKLVGTITPPSSKSHSIRALLFAACAHGRSELHNLLQSPDIQAMKFAITKLGAIVTTNHNITYVAGNNGKMQAMEPSVYVANSGQVLRFMSALFALQPTAVTLSGDASANQRPMLPLINALNDLGANCKQLTKNASAPVQISGTISKDKVTILGADSQFVSALLMALPFKKTDTTILVSNPGETPWIDLTLSWLDRMQLTYEYRSDYTYYKLSGNAKVNAFKYTVPTDFSSMAFPLVAALITKATIVIDNLDFNSKQGDANIIQLVQQLGARVDVTHNKVTVYPSDLVGQQLDLNDCIDAVPIMTVLALAATGSTTLTNIAIARTKESDRITVMEQELNKLGAKITSTYDQLTIEPTPLAGGIVDSHHDHRVAMALIIAGMITKQQTIVQNIDCISKSYPNFIENMQQLGANLQVQQAL